MPPSGSRRPPPIPEFLYENLAYGAIHFEANAVVTSAALQADLNSTENQSCLGVITDSMALSRAAVLFREMLPTWTPPGNVNFAVVTDPFCA